ncbi:microtubule-associated protein futsch-like [Montipora capricornis]|uniref:microtubule-associated protein futsch-like n=1 Tax=Montipora capricornis TaxID=246305 RepID=UPI0035F20631
MDAMEYIFSLAREDSSNVLEFHAECIMEEDLMSLSSKFPLIPGSQRSITFCTTPVSHMLQKMPSDADFDLTDPYSPPPRYNFLHDPHLKEYFQNAAMRKRLVDKGFITPSGYVKCTLLEFNMFRQWIRKLKLDRIHQGRRRERQVEKEKRREEKVRAQILRNGELYNILRHREQNARELRERGIMRREADRKKFLKLQEIDKKRREKHRETMKRKKDINECQREKNLAQKEVEKVEEEEKARKHKIRILIKRNVEGKEREMMLQKRRASLIEERERKVSVHHDTCLQRIRNALAKQHQEAQEFLQKMRERKLKEMEAWKQRHARMREAQMQQPDGMVSLLGKESRLGPEQRRRSRLSSLWDIQSSLKTEFGIEDNVVYSGVVFADRKKATRQSLQLEALAEEAASQQRDESEQFRKLLSRLETEIAVRERVHEIVFDLISKAQYILDLERRFDVAREIPSYVQYLLENAQRILYSEGTIQETRGFEVDTKDEIIREAAQQIVSEAVHRAMGEIQQNESLRETANEIVASAISSACAKTLLHGLCNIEEDKDTVKSAAVDIAEKLSDCAKDIVTAAIVSALRLKVEKHETATARRLAIEAVGAAKASLEQLYGMKFELAEEEQKPDTEETFKSLDECAKDLTATAIIAGTKSLERTITSDDHLIITARSLASNAVASAKASLETFYGVKIEEENEDWEDSSKDISKRLVISARDIAQGVISSTTQLLEKSDKPDTLENRAAQVLATDAIQAAIASLEDLFDIKVDFADKNDIAAKKIAAAAVVSVTGSRYGKELERNKVDLTVATRELASTVVDSVKTSMDELMVTISKVKPDAIKDAEKLLQRAAKNIAQIAVDSATRSLLRVSQKSEWNLKFTTRELVRGVLDSAKASLEKVYGIQIESEESLALLSQETSSPSLTSSSYSSESSLSEGEHEEKLKEAAQRLALDAIKSATVSLERLHSCAKEMEANIKTMAFEISKSLVDSSGNVSRQLEEEGLGIAARNLACRAIESAATSVLKLYNDEVSLQDIIASDSRLLQSAAKVATISARSSLGELFDRGFFGGVELDEATGYFATHALVSAETMLEKVQDSSDTRDLDMEICKAASELTSHAVISAEGSVDRFVQFDLPEPSETSKDYEREHSCQGTLFWKISTYVEGLINRALRRLGTSEYDSIFNEGPEDYEVITREQASLADAEYGQRETDLYQREILALKASRIINNVVENAIDIVKTKRKNGTFFSGSKSSPGDDPFPGQSCSSVDFKEEGPRRESCVPREIDFLSSTNRPFSPQVRKPDAGAVVVSRKTKWFDKELDMPPPHVELSKGNIFNSDVVEKPSSDPAPILSPKPATPPEPVRSASDSNMDVDELEASLNQKQSVYDIIKEREETASCDISPCGSYVVLPNLNPSERSLIAARVETYEIMWNQNNATSSITNLPSLSSKGSFITSNAVEQGCQRKEPRNRPVPSPSRLPNISSSTSKITSAGSSNQSFHQPRRTSSEILKRGVPKPFTKTSKESVTMKSPTGKDIQPPSGSVGKMTTSSGSSLHLKEGMSQKKAKSVTALPLKDSARDVLHLHYGAAPKKHLSPEGSLIKASLSSSSDKVKSSSSDSKLKRSSQTSVSALSGRPSMDVLTAQKTRRSPTMASPHSPLDRMVSASSEEASLSPRASKGRVGPSPRTSKEQVALSTKTSIGKVKWSPRGSTENAALSFRASQGDVSPSPRTTTRKAASSPSSSKTGATQPPSSSTENASVCPRGSKGKIVKSPNGSNENAMMSPKTSRGNVMQSPRVSTENTVNVAELKRESKEKDSLSQRSSEPNVTQVLRASSEPTALSSNVAKKEATMLSDEENGTSLSSPFSDERKGVESCFSGTKMELYPHSSEVKAALPSDAVAEEAVGFSPRLTEKVLSKITMSKSLQGTDLRSDTSQVQEVGFELDQDTVNKKTSDGDVEENRNVKKFVPSLERIIQEKRLTPEGAEADTRPASTVADVLELKTSADPDEPRNTIPALADQTEDIKETDALKSFPSKSLPSTEIKGEETWTGQGSPRNSKTVIAPKRRHEVEVACSTKKPEGKEIPEAHGAPSVLESVLPEKRGQEKKSDKKMPNSSTLGCKEVSQAKQEPVGTARSTAGDVKGYKPYRMFGVSRSVHDTLDDIVQRMLSSADEPSVVEVSRPTGRGSFEEIKRISEKRLDEPGRFAREGRLSGRKVSNTVIETMSFMLQTVSSSDHRSPRGSSERKFSGSDIQGVCGECYWGV